MNLDRQSLVRERRGWFPSTPLRAFQKAAVGAVSRQKATSGRPRRRRRTTSEFTQGSLGSSAAARRTSDGKTARPVL